jgi:hypothetical protein
MHYANVSVLQVGKLLAGASGEYFHKAAKRTPSDNSAAVRAETSRSEVSWIDRRDHLCGTGFPDRQCWNIIVRAKDKAPLSIMGEVSEERAIFESDILDSRSGLGIPPKHFTRILIAGD